MFYNVQVFLLWIKKKDFELFSERLLWFCCRLSLGLSESLILFYIYEKFKGIIRTFGTGNVV